MKDCCYYMLDFPGKSDIIEKQLKSRQFETILSINKTTGNSPLQSKGSEK